MDFKDQRRPGTAARDLHRAAGPPGAVNGQRAREQVLQFRVLRLSSDREHAALVAELVAFRQDGPGPVVRLQDASAAVQLDDPRPPAFQ